MNKTQPQRYSIIRSAEYFKANPPGGDVYLVSGDRAADNALTLFIVAVFA